MYAHWVCQVAQVRPQGTKAKHAFFLPRTSPPLVTLPDQGPRTAHHAEISNEPSRAGSSQWWSGTAARGWRKVSAVLWALGARTLVEPSEVEARVCAQHECKSTFVGAGKPSLSRVLGCSCCRYQQQPEHSAAASQQASKAAYIRAYAAYVPAGECLPRNVTAAHGVHTRARVRPVYLTRAVRAARGGAAKDDRVREQEPVSRQRGSMGSKNVLMTVKN